MTNEPFLLVSLEESESKDLAQAITNKSSRKILDYLSKEESATESAISKKLKIPLSTVHYNLQALSKANLVIAEEFHYSEKGKEVLHYKLANKLIIIAPKKQSKESFLEKLKGIIPIGIIALATGLVIQMFSWLKVGAGKMVSFGASDAILAKSAVEEVAPQTMRVLPGAAPMMAESADLVVGAANTAAQNITEPAKVIIKEVFVPIAQPATSEPNVALWFVIGVVFTLLLSIVWYWFATRKKNKVKKKNKK